MPAIFDSLVTKQHLSTHAAWRVAFIVPFIIITATAIAMLLLCPDTPTGKWSERHLAVQHNLQAHGVNASGVVDVPGAITDRKVGGTTTPSTGDEKRLEEEAGLAKAKHGSFDHEAPMAEEDMLNTAKGEVIVKPTLKEAMTVIFSPQTAVVALCYFCSFGAELAINSILGQYYLKNFKSLGQTGTGRWAAMFGLLNVVFRPLGGIVSDFLYKKSGSVWSKKIWLHSLAIICGAFQIAIGVLDSKSHSTMFGLVAGMAFFLEAGNGANFSLVPHVHPFANGIISGVTGATGNFGGIIFGKWSTKGPLVQMLTFSSDHLQIPWYGFWQNILDHRCHHHCSELACMLDKANSQGTNWWSLNQYLIVYLIGSWGVVITSPLVCF